MHERDKTDEEILNRLNRRLGTLYQCNSVFFQAESEQELVQSICEVLVAGGELRLAWIGYCEDDAEKTIRPVAQAGYGLDYLERVKISWGEGTEAGQGPFGIAVRTGKACRVDDIRTDPSFSLWRAAALAHGYASCVAVPLIAFDKRKDAVDLRGTLNLYSAERNAFDESSVEHYTGLAASMTYAVTALRSRLAEDLTSGVTTLRASGERKRAQEELRRSEAYLAEAQRLSLTGSFGWNVSSGEIFWSEESFRIFGSDRATKPTVELILQRVHPQDAALVKQTIESASQDGKDFDFEHRLLMPDGSVKYVHVVARAKRDEPDGLEFIGAVMDTTESKRAEEALRRSESYLAEAQRLTHTGSWAFNAITPLYWSEENFRIWGFDPQQGLPDRETMLQRIHPEDRDRVVEHVQNAVRERRDYVVEFRIVLPDGAVRYIHGLGHTSFSASGELVEVVGTNVDVTDRKRAEMLLAGEKRLLEMIARGDSSALIFDGLCRLVEELASGSLSSILLLDPNTNRLRHGAAPSLPIAYTEAIDGSAIGPSVGSCGTAAYRAEPVVVTDIATDPLWADYRDLALAHGLRACWSTPILSSQGRVLGTFATYYRERRSPTPEEHNVIEQITQLASIAVERGQAEEALRQAQADLAHVTRVATLGEMTASIAHEINQPLGAVVNNASACLRWLAASNPEEARQSAALIIADAHRASEIIGRIRAFVKKAPPKKAWFNINETVLEVTALARSEVQRHRVSLETHLADGVPLILGDRIQLQQVILNLVMNGIEAMSAVTDRSRDLLIRSGQYESDKVLVEVQDSGIGLQPESLDHLFTAFFTTKPQGMGMGLAISRSIIEAHGGRLWASRNDGSGATFRFTLHVGSKEEEPLIV
jgi:PAS domain S-box-containing protein